MAHDIVRKPLHILDQVEDRLFRHHALAAGLALAAMLFTGGASAQRNTFDGLRQCERFAAIEFRKRNPQFKRFTIDRASAETDKYAGQVGTQFVSTVYQGEALYDGGQGERTVRFICLHAGRQRGPVFVYTLD